MRKTLIQQAIDAAKLVHPIFVQNGWTWWNTAPDVPTVEQLESHIFSLLCVAENDGECGTVSSGRITIITIEPTPGEREFEVLVDVDSGWINEVSD
jgi:hypothetical protein